MRFFRLAVPLFLPMDTEELFFLHFAVLHRHPVSFRGGQTCFFSRMIASVLFLRVSFLSVLYITLFPTMFGRDTRNSKFSNYILS